MPTETEVPAVKLAKVNQDQERKKGAVVPPGLGGAGSSSGVSGAAGSSIARMGGSGILRSIEGVFGKAVAMAMPKILVATMVCCLGYGAVAVGQAMRAAERMREAAVMPKTKTFAQKPAPDVRTDGVVQTHGMQDSLRMVGGGMYGQDAAQAAAEAAKDDKTKNDAAAPADQPNATAGAAGPGGPAGMMDPAAMAAAATANAKAGGDQKDQKGGSGKGFGSFAGSLGGGGGGSFGISAGGPGAPAGQIGGARAFGGNVSDSRVTSAMGRGSGLGRGLSNRQLGQVAALSRQAARSGVPETMSANAGQAFQPGAGSDQAITGGGARTEGVGPRDSSPAGGGASGGAGSAGGSNPSVSQGGGGSSMDNCDVMFPNGGFVNSGQGGCVCPPGQDASGYTCTSVRSTNASPWQKMSDMAKWLLLGAGVILLIAALIGKLANTGPEAKAAWYPIAKYLCYIAMVMAGIATLLGISMAVMGGQAQVQGVIYTIGGAITTIMAYKAADGFEPKSSTEVSNAATAKGPPSAANNPAPEGGKPWPEGAVTQQNVNGTSQMFVPGKEGLTPYGGTFPTSGTPTVGPNPYAGGAIGGDYGGAGYGAIGGGTGLAGGALGGLATPPPTH